MVEREFREGPRNVVLDENSVPSDWVEWAAACKVCWGCGMICVCVCCVCVYVCVCVCVCWTRTAFPLTGSSGRLHARFVGV